MTRILVSSMNFMTPTNSRQRRLQSTEGRAAGGISSSRPAMDGFLPTGKKKAPGGAFFIQYEEATSLSCGQDFDFLARSVVAAILDDAVGQREQGVVPPHPDILPRVNARTKLAHQDIAGAYGLAAKDFHAAALPMTIAPVA
jgi:hypothetical protein